MKKLISLLLAVSVMAMSSTAFAANSYLGAGGQRNPGSYSDVTGGRNSGVLRPASQISNAQGKVTGQKILAVYRPGDEITFSRGDYTIAAGDVITFISSKVNTDNVNESTYTDATVMFIDQVIADSTSPSYTYKLREDLAEGVYKIDIKIGENAAAPYFYAVGAPKVDVLYVDEDETTQYLYDEVGQRAQYFAVASIGTGYVLFEQAGVARFGFDSGSIEATTFAAEVFDNAMLANELDAAEFVFTIQINDVPSASDLPAEVDGTIVNE